MLGTLVRRVAVITTILSAPLALDPSRGIRMNDACASGGGSYCCPENGSICFIGDQRTMDAYWTNVFGPCLEPEG